MVVLVLFKTMLFWRNLNQVVAAGPKMAIERDSVSKIELPMVSDTKRDGIV